ncbi:MAG TPA: class F sortase [Oculatellaceae cyanobacterium]
MALDRINNEVPSSHAAHNLYERVMPQLKPHLDKPFGSHSTHGDQVHDTKSSGGARGASDKAGVTRASGLDAGPIPVLPPGSPPVEQTAAPTQTTPPEKIPAPTPPSGPPTEKPPTPKPPEKPPTPTPPPSSPPTEKPPAPKPPSGSSTEGGNPPNPGNQNQNKPEVSPYSPPAFISLPLPPHEHHSKHHDNPQPKTPDGPPLVPPPLEPLPLKPSTPDVPVVPPVVPTKPLVPPPDVPIPPPKTTTVPPKDVPPPPHPSTPPHDTVPHKTPPGHPKIPTNVFTGQGASHSQAVMESKYKAIYGGGKQGNGHFEHLICDELGQESGARKDPLILDVEPVGTGKDRGMKHHQTEMVAPKDPMHLGVWKYSDAGVTGKTIIVGHVVFGGTPGPFYKLHDLGVHNGTPDRVTLADTHGHKTTYQFSGREIVKNPNDQKVWNRVFGAGDPKHKELELITCAGPVDHGVHKWRLIDHLTEVKSAASASSPSVKKIAIEVSHSKVVVPGAVETAVSQPAVAPKSEAEPVKTDKTDGKSSLPADSGKLVAPVQERVEQTSTIGETTAKPAPTHAESSVGKLVGQSEDKVMNRAADKPADKPCDKNTAQAQAALDAAQSKNVAQPSMEASTVSSPGQPLGARITFDNTFKHAHGSMTGTSVELGGDLRDGKLSYLTAGPNFTFVNNDTNIVRANLKLGIGTGSDLLSTDLPERGFDRLSISTQFDATHRLNSGAAAFGDTSAYFAGAFGVGTRGTQELLETGLEQYNGHLLLRAGLQASKDRNAPIGTYGVLGATYYSGRYFVGATAEQPLNAQSGQSRRPTVMLSAGFSF